MKTDDAGKKKGLLGSILKTVTGSGSCCAPGDACCSPKSGTVETAYSGDKKICIKVYDPPMCCSSGVCGPNVNSALVEFSGALKSLVEHGIGVERWNLSQEPQAFAENSQVKEQLTKLRKDALPLIWTICDGRKLSPLPGSSTRVSPYPKPPTRFLQLGVLMN